MKMAGQQQSYSSRYPSLLLTVKHDTDQRSIPETYSNSRTRRYKDNYRPSTFQPKNIYYNSNHQHQQQQQYYIRPLHTSPCRQQQQFYNNHDRNHFHYQQQPIRPLMEIKDNLLPLHDNNDDDDEDEDDNDTSYRSYKQKEPKQRGQYRNRKAELDWDHAFDLDLIDLYTPHIDVDSRSLTSTISSSDNSFSSF